MILVQAIVAIGGGELGDGETLPIDREVVRLAETTTPTAVFLPTASGDEPGYIEAFESVYGEELGCDTTTLRLTDDPGPDTIRETIGAADLVYVGGGNTRRMMHVWREHDVDDILRQAHEAGTVLAGLSAGAICWCSGGHSDSEKFETDGDDWDYTRVDGLGLVPDILFCPHYTGEGRRDSFHDLMRSYPGMTGIAADDCAAISIVSDQYRILRSAPDASVYRVYAGKSGVREERVPVFEKYVPLHTLHRH